MPFPENIASFYIRQNVRMHERIAKVNGEQFDAQAAISELLSALAHQTPNRIYCSDDGLTGNVVFFEDLLERYPFNMYWEVMRGNDEQQLWETVRKDSLVCADRDSLEEQIRQLRARFRLRGDLLLKPDEVFVIDDPNLVRAETAYIHTLRMGETRFVTQYHLGQIGASFSPI